MSNVPSKKVLILHTGGTFGMELEKISLDDAPLSPNFLRGLLKQFPDLKKVAQVDLKIICNIDSSDASPHLWKTLAKRILKSWDDYDGFVIIHGTDTMAYTGCALSYLLPVTQKPIVLSGSQRPFHCIRSDARNNLLDAVELATIGLPRIMICFDGKAHRATRVTKHSSTNFNAFKSHNEQIIGEFGVNFRLSEKYRNILSQDSKHAPSSHQPQMSGDFDSKILTLKVTPGTHLTEELIETITSHYAGILVEGFGAGNLPITTGLWKKLCEMCLQRKIPLVITSQCKSGSVALSLYKNGMVYASLGAIPAMDMTVEAASVKLMFMIGSKIPFDGRFTFFATPLNGECTPNQDRDLKI